MRKQLLLDFVEIKPKLMDINALVHCFKVISKDLKLMIMDIDYKDSHSQAVLNILYFDKSHIAVTVFKKMQSAALNCLVNLPELQLIKLEEKICEEFGWTNCTGQILLDRCLFPCENQIESTGRSFTLLNHTKDKADLHKDLTLIHKQRTKYHTLAIYDSPKLPRFLTLDNFIQVSDSDEYDKFTIDLVSQAVQSIEKPTEVLIIGGGDFLSAIFLIDNYNVSRITIVELDEGVVDCTKKYFKYAKNVDQLIGLGRIEIVIDEGSRFLQRERDAGRTFDCVIIDNISFEGEEFYSIFCSEFYSVLNKVIRPGGSFSQGVSCGFMKLDWENMVMNAGFTGLRVVPSYMPEKRDAVIIVNALKVG